MSCQAVEKCIHAFLTGCGWDGVGRFGIGGDGWAWVGMDWDGDLGSVGLMGDQMGAGTDRCGQKGYLGSY